MPPALCCKRCGRRLVVRGGRLPRLGLCHVCWHFASCRLCGVYTGRAGWCETCEVAVDRAAWIRDTGPVVRPDPVTLAERLLLYTARAARGEPLFTVAGRL